MISFLEPKDAEHYAALFKIWRSDIQHYNPALMYMRGDFSTPHCYDYTAGDLCLRLPAGVVDHWRAADTYLKAHPELEHTVSDNGTVRMVDDEWQAHFILSTKGAAR